MISLEVFAALAGFALILYVCLKHRAEMRKIECLRDGAEYARGLHDGMEKAAILVESGEGAQQSGPFSPSGEEFARMIRAANIKLL